MFVSVTGESIGSHGECGATGGARAGVPRLGSTVFGFDPDAGPLAACHLKVREGQSNSTRTIAQTMPHPIHVMFGWAACHSRILLWMVIRMSLIKHVTERERIKLIQVNAARREQAGHVAGLPRDLSGKVVRGAVAGRSDYSFVGPDRLSDIHQLCIRQRRWGTWQTIATTGCESREQNTA
jgi:hypothetical protein